jgi:hypothetical protein
MNNYQRPSWPVLGSPIIEPPPGFIRNVPPRKGHPLRDTAIAMGLVVAVIWARKHKERPAARAILITEWTIACAFVVPIGTGILEQAAFHDNSSVPAAVAMGVAAVTAGVGRWLSLRKYAKLSPVPRRVFAVPASAATRPAAVDVADAIPAAQAQRYLEEFRQEQFIQPESFTIQAEREKTRLLAQVADSLGFYVEWHRDMEAAGQTDLGRRVIKLDTGTDVTSRVSVLAHELAHVLGAYQTRGEIEADGVAYIVCRTLGSRYALGYEQIYAVPANLRTKNIVAAAQEILRRYVKLGGLLPQPPVARPRTDDAPAEHVTHVAVNGNLHQGPAGSCHRCGSERS